MVDEYYKRELEKRKKGKASIEHLNHLEALSKIDGSHKEHLKIMRNSIKKYYAFLSYLDEDKTIKIISGQAWSSGFSWALKNIKQLNKK